MIGCGMINGKTCWSASDRSDKFEAAGILSEEKLTGSFSKVLGCGVMRVRPGSKSVASVSSCGCGCDAAESSKQCGRGFECFEIHCHAGEQSERFGGKYIYFCPVGMVFIICPISRIHISMTGTASGTASPDYLVCGPISLVESEDFDIEELIGRIGVNNVKPELSAERILEHVRRAPVFPPEKITYAADLLYVCAKHLSVTDNYASYENYDKNVEIYEQQKQIGEYIQSIKMSLIRESGYNVYPYDKEKLLIHSIIHNDLENSRKYLNEILGHIFFSSATNLDVIKVRAMELSVMISRAALDGGADHDKISGINERFIHEFFGYQTIEEVCWSLTNILRKFTRETFEFAQIKHIDVISKAVAYVKSNCARKLTLNEVAEYVFLSPSYFSKIFKQEMNCYFKDYVNYIRVEKSKVLLLTEKMSLVDIADSAGFYDQSYFNKVFKKITGVTPKKFREAGGKALLASTQFSKRQGV